MSLFLCHDIILCNVHNLNSLVSQLVYFFLSRWKHCILLCWDSCDFLPAILYLNYEYMCFTVSMVQLISKLTLMCTEHACVIQFLSSDTCLKHVWHATGCTRAIFCGPQASDIHVLHMSHSSRVLHASHCTVNSLIYVPCTHWL